jgi:hypothetical protein
LAVVPYNGTVVQNDPTGAQDRADALQARETVLSKTVDCLKVQVKKHREVIDLQSDRIENLEIQKETLNLKLHRADTVIKKTDTVIKKRDENTNHLLQQLRQHHQMEVTSLRSAHHVSDGMYQQDLAALQHRYDHEVADNRAQVAELQATIRRQQIQRQQAQNQEAEAWNQEVLRQLLQAAENQVAENQVAENQVAEPQEDTPQEDAPQEDIDA